MSKQKQNEPLPSVPDFPNMEEQIMAQWKTNDTFKKSVNLKPADNAYVFYDGPPFATGMPHYGHLLASTTKDVIPRYQTMKGKRVERVWGWDCHGLPIENIIEKKLNLADKKSIEDFGIDKFNETCRNTVLTYAEDWKKVIHRIGRWVDMENDYRTMDPNYMESLWWVFKELWTRGLIYQGYKSMHICPRCSTTLSNFEVTQGYKEVDDLSVIAEFKSSDLQKRIDVKETVFFLAWTTTPWTLPGNLLLAVDPNQTYVVFSGSEPGNLYVVAEPRLKDVLNGYEGKVVKTFKGSDLVGVKYEPVFPYYKETEKAFKVVGAEFVSMEEGTGIVHIAPAFGEDDFELGKEHDLDLVQHVGMDGKFVKKVTDFAGLPVRPKDDRSQTDRKLIQYLQDNDRLFSQSKVRHTYPHCWRCDTPLLNYAANSWFVRVTKIKKSAFEKQPGN